MPTSTVFSTTFLTLCQAAGAPFALRRVDGYHATDNQIVFFALATGRQRLPKRRETKEGDAYAVVIEERDDAAITAIADAIAYQLTNASGEVVTSLRREITQSDSQAWSAFLVQMRTMLRQLAKRFGYPLASPTQDETLSKSLAKLLTLFHTMPLGSTLDGATDILAFSSAQLRNSGALYNFHKPFLNYVFGILHNELRRTLTKDAAHAKRIHSLDEALLLSSEPNVLSEEEESAYQQQLGQLQQLLPALFNAIDTLPRKRRQVAIYSLASRSQFTLALQLAVVPAPVSYPPRERYTTDLQIAEQLAMSANSVRANRNYAYRDLVAIDPVLGRLFATLIDVRF